MAQAQVLQPAKLGDSTFGGPFVRVFRCTSNGGETSTVINFASYGMKTVLKAQAYTITGAAQIAEASVVLTAKTTVTVTHTANHTIYVYAIGLADDVTAAG